MFRRISLRARARVLVGSAILGVMVLTQMPGAFGADAPSVAISPDPINAASQSAVTVSGAATGVTAHIVLADAALNTVSVDAPVTDGAYSAVLDATALEDGTLTATVTVTDAENVVSEPGSATAQLDTIAPAPGTLTFADTDGYINASEAQTNLPVTWDGPDDAVSASVWFADVDGSLKPGCGPWASAVDATGALPNYCTPNLQDGVITFRGTWTDAAGNVGAEGSGSSILDRATTIAITAPADGSAVSPSQVTVTGTAEPGATVTLTDGGVPVGTATTASGAWSFDILSPVDGAHSLVASAVDVPGNTASVSSTFTVDDLIPVIARPLEGSLEPGVTVVTGTAQPASFVEVFEVVGTTSTMILRTPVSATGTWSAQGGFHTGAHTIKARGVTRLGETSAFTVTRSFTIDGNRPTVTIDNADMQQSPEAITGTATDTPGVIRVELRYFNELTGALMAVRDATCTGCGATGAAVTWTDTPVTGLLMRVEAVAIDVVGQRSPIVGRRYLAP